MKLIDNILYIEFADFISAGWKDAAVLNANFRNGAYWRMIRNPDDKRKPLVQYDTLRQAHKEKLIQHFGNPYEFIAKEPIRQMLVFDAKAEAFYNAYRYDGKTLPLEHKVKYTTAASWLNLVSRLNADKRLIKKELNLTLEKFWISVCDIIKADGIELPSSYNRLLAKIKEYQDSGYACLIDWRFGNKNTAKIGKSADGFDTELYEKQTAIIRKAASLPQNFDAMQIANAVNTIFEKQGWPSISHATVYNIIKANNHLTLPGRRGKREWSSQIAMQHLRKRPEMPLHFLSLDGWTVELLYQDGNTYHNRLVAVIVIDTLNDYPIGYAIGDRENTDLIRQANRNAMTHIHELFGEYYQPFQLQSDNYGLKNLTPFYRAMGHLHTPAAVGNAKAKPIEPYFNLLNKRYFQRFPNWSGFNTTSRKENQPNTEFLDKIKTTFPDKQGVIKQIEMVIAQDRKSKIDAYMQAWRNTPDTEKLVMSKEDRLMVYGRPTNYTNSITGMGLTITIGGEKMIYDSFDPAFRALNHIKWQVVFDECDTEQILAISEDDKRRFVLDRKRALPMDVRSMTPDDHEFHSKITQFNKTRMEEIVQTYISDAEVVNEVIGSSNLNIEDYNEAAIKLMFTYNGQQKEAIQNAKGLKTVQAKIEKEDAAIAQNDNKTWQQLQDEYLENKTDYNQYLD